MNVVLRNGYRCLCLFRAMLTCRAWYFIATVPKIPAYVQPRILCTRSLNVDFLRQLTCSEYCRASFCSECKRLVDIEMTKVFIGTIASNLAENMDPHIYHRARRHQ